MSRDRQIKFGDVLRFAAGYWRRQPVKLCLVVGMLIIASVLETYLPSALANMLAAVRQELGRDVITHRLWIFLGLYGLQALIAIAAHRVYNIFEPRIFKQVLDDAFAHVQFLSERFFINTFAGSLISKITRGRSQIEAFQDRVILNLVPTMVVAIGSLVFLALRFAAMAACLTVYIVIMIGISTFMVMRVAGPAQGKAADAQDAANARLADCISGIATTKSFARERDEIASYGESTEDLRRQTTRAYLLGGLTYSVQYLLILGMLAILMGGGIWYVLQGRANVESLAYLTLAYTILQGYVRDLGETIRRLLTSSYDLHGVIGILREPQDVADRTAADPLAIARGSIDFERVVFTYPGKESRIFDGLNVSIAHGERVALVGHSGSGKTSFVRLVQRLYDVQQGRILIDGQDISHGTQASLRAAIALVPQDPVLFHRSLRDNIAYSKPGASFEDVRAAADKAHIDKFIMGLPQGYDTLVGERGIKLSGGERQRVAIARAIVADRPILILDEATSSLDSESERAIQDALLALTHGRTSIMIAHRLSTILDADRILVFDKGRIAEEGTHAELAAMENGIYAGFFRLQSGGFIHEDE
jgi:ATP-binding cassette subfamily B protein